jgi:hypothetical protein
MYVNDTESGWQVFQNAATNFGIVEWGHASARKDAATRDSSARIRET